MSRRNEYKEDLVPYFRDVSKYKKKLTYEDEYDLGIRIKNGDEDALNELVTHNLKFVVNIAKGYKNKTKVPFSDLISSGNYGLITAAKRFNPINRDNKFICYAVWWIKYYIQDCIKEYNDKIDSSLFEDYEDNENFVKEEILSDVNNSFEFQMDFLKSQQTAIKDLVSCLEEREKRVIMLFYGFNDAEPLNLTEIGKKMSLTTERVRQIKDYALVKLKCYALDSSDYDNYRQLT